MPISSAHDSTDQPEQRPRPREFLLEDPEAAPRRARFRRRLLWVVGSVVVFAVAIVVARTLIARWTLAQSYEAWMRRDLGELAVLQAEYHATHGSFANRDQLGTDFVPSQGVHVDIHDVTSTGWSATAIHVRSRTVCAVSIAADAAGSPEDSVSCRRP